MSNLTDEFYTFRGYTIKHHGLSPSMEDYLEMIFRLTRDKSYTRINDLASALNVQPPSATKMVQKLAELSYLKYEKYGTIELTSKGKEVGTMLFKRHEALENFLNLIGVEKNTLKDTEKIEHNLSDETLSCIFKLTEFLKTSPEFLKGFKNFSQTENDKDN